LTAPAAIAVEQLRVVRGGKTVLPGLDVEIHAGRVTGLLGPSGSGKSTLLRAIVGVQIIESGAVRVLGLPAGSPPLRRRVAYTTQAPSIYGDLTVRENLHYFARLLGVGASDVDSAIGAVRLGEDADAVVNRLSGGQKARASLATALLGRPEVLILDEPTVGLDPLLRRDLWALFRSLAEAGATLVVSSHVMDEAASCHVLVLLREGAIVAHESPEAIRERTGTDDMSEAFVRLIEQGGA
jgi:ABC-2 type transport system ATP-binding protein